MAKGWDRVAQQSEERRQRQEQWDAQKKPQLWMKDNDVVVMRFLEQGPDIHHYLEHEYWAMTGQGRKRRYFTCLNDKEDGTRCPGCEAGLKTRTRGVFNIIQRQRPQLRRGQDGKAMKDSTNNYIVDGHKDEIVIWECPSTTLDLLRQKEGKIGGLMAGDIEISRTGTQFSPYLIEVADMAAWPLAMSAEDEQLVAGGKHDLDEFKAPPSFADAAKLTAGQAQQGGQGQQAQPSQEGAATPADPTNVFMGDRQS